MRKPPAGSMRYTTTRPELEPMSMPARGSRAACGSSGMSGLLDARLVRRRGQPPVLAADGRGQGQPHEDQAEVEDREMADPQAQQRGHEDRQPRQHVAGAPEE